MILYQSGRNSIKYVITQLQRPLVKVLLIPYDDVWRLDRRVLITGIGDPLKTRLTTLLEWEMSVVAKMELVAAQNIGSPIVHL